MEDLSKNPLPTTPISTPPSEVKSVIQETPEVKPKKSNLSQILLSLLMFFLGGIIVFTFFKFLKKEKTVPQPVVSPTPVSIPSPLPSLDPTVNWQTYKNEEYQYEFNHPENWVLGFAPEDLPSETLSSISFLAQTLL